MARTMRVVGAVLAITGVTSACGSGSSSPSSQPPSKTIAPAVEGHNYVRTGAVDAGVFTSKNAIPGLSLRVPEAGWRVVDTWDVALTLRPPKPSGAQIQLVNGFVAVSPQDEPLASSSSPSATVAGLRRNDGLTVSATSTAALGGKARATVVDLSARGGNARGVDFLAASSGTSNVLTLEPGTSARLLLLSIRQPYGRDTLDIIVSGPAAAAASWNRLATSVLRTLRLPHGVTAVAG